MVLIVDSDVTSKRFDEKYGQKLRNFHDMCSVSFVPYIKVHGSIHAELKIEYKSCVCPLKK